MWARVVGRAAWCRAVEGEDVVGALVEVDQVEEDHVLEEARPLGRDPAVPAPIIQIAMSKSSIHVFP